MREAHASQLSQQCLIHTGRQCCRAGLRLLPQNWGVMGGGWRAALPCALVQQRLRPLSKVAILPADQADLLYLCVAAVACLLEPSESDTSGNETSAHSKLKQVLTWEWLALRVQVHSNPELVLSPDFGGADL